MERGRWHLPCRLLEPLRCTSDPNTREGVPLSPTDPLPRAYWQAQTDQLLQRVPALEREKSALQAQVAAAKEALHKAAVKPARAFAVCARICRACFTAARNRRQHQALRKGGGDSRAKAHSVAVVCRSCLRLFRPHSSSAVSSRRVCMPVG